MNKLVTLASEKDFAHARFRKTFSSANFRIRVAPGMRDFPRFAFIVSKKTLPKVTDRNKVKRRARSVVIKNLKRFKPMDILIFPAKTALKHPFSNLEIELSSDFKRMGLWKI